MSHRDSLCFIWQTYLVVLISVSEIRTFVLFVYIMKNQSAITYFSMQKMKGDYKVPTAFIFKALNKSVFSDYLTLKTDILI